MTVHSNSNWAGGLRAELLRYFSGYSILGIIAFSALVPWFVANFVGWPDNADQLSTADNIQAFWALATTIAIVATFAGSYLVTRESYYGTLRHSVVMSGPVQLVAVKYAAALVVGLGTLAAGILAWGASVVFTLTPELRVNSSPQSPGGPCPASWPRQLLLPCGVARWAGLFGITTRRRSSPC